MKSWNDVEFDEELSMSQTIEGLLQLKNEILIFDDDVVKFSIIHTYLNTSPKFMNKDYWGADEGCAETYEFFLKIFIQSFFKHFKLISDHEI